MAYLDAKRTGADAGVLTRPINHPEVKTSRNIGPGEPLLPLRSRENPLWDQQVSD